MSSHDLYSTMDLPSRLVLEAWEDYVRTVRAPSVGDFTAWVKENQPDVLLVIRERTLVSIAKEIEDGKLTASKWPED